MAKTTPAKPATAPQQARGSPVISVAVLVGLVALAVDALHIQLGRINYSKELMAPLLDPRDTSLRKHFTGLAPIDGFLVILLPMFESVVNGETPQLSLNVFYFIGQLVSILVLALSIGNRQGKSWNVTRL